VVLGLDFFAVCLGVFLGPGVTGFAACVAGFTAVAGDAGFASGAADFFVEAAGLICPAEAGAGAGFSGVFAIGFAACGAGFVAAGVAGFAPVPLAGFACAYRPGATAASVIPSMRVFTKRICRSFPFRVSPPVSPRLLKVRRRHSAW
jgi:hypothetical protein